MFAADNDLSKKTRFLFKVLPGIAGIALYAVNNAAVIHGLISPPAGFMAMGVQRDPDVAQYITWLRGLETAWTLPNYHAPWTTTPGLIVPGLMPASLLQRAFSLSPVTALQLYSLIAYICAAYALAFALRTFCRTRSQALWSLIFALSCVPVASLPGLFSALKGHDLSSSSAGVVEFINSSDGFLHGLGTWPMMTLGTGAQLLAMALLARWCNSHELRWLGWLGVVVTAAAWIHPFEVFVTMTVAAVVLLRQAGPLVENIKRVLFVAACVAVGLCPYLVQVMRVPWLRQLSDANRHLVSILPVPLLAMIGIPAIVAAFLLLLGLPDRTVPDTLILKVWFLANLILFYVPGIPFAVHLLDGFFFVVGLLLAAQLEPLFQRQPEARRKWISILAVPVLAWMMFPHVTMWKAAWRAGNAVNAGAFPSAVAPVDEVSAVEWLRKNADANSLVLGTEDAAPWLATVPMHSFASHYVLSLKKYRPGDDAVRNAFFAGTLQPPHAQELLQTLGARFVVVPDDSRAVAILGDASLRAHFTRTSIYEFPGARMKPYGDPEIIALGAWSSP